MMVQMMLFALMLIYTMDSIDGCQRIVCYYTNWAQYRQQPYKFYPENIDPNLCTHINYAFAKLSENRLVPYEWNDDRTDWNRGMYDRTIGFVKERKPEVKVLLSVGGWTLGSWAFSSMVATAEGRAEFAATSVTFLRERGFDGLDIDWEYPANRGSPPTDKMNFVELLKVVSREFEVEATSTGNSRLLLTAAVAAGKEVIDSGYNVTEISKYLDFVNIMTYDLHGAWEPITGHVSPLYSRPGETETYLNIDWVVKYWNSLGLPKEKLVVGLSTYGRSFTLSSRSSNSIGAGSKGVGRQGQFTRSEGFLAYYEICGMIRDGAMVRRIPEQRVPYAVYDDQWVGYDDEQSLREKVQYMLDNGYGGVMIWAFDLDDFAGVFCGKGSYPLLNAIADQCSGNNSGVKLPSEETQEITTAAETTTTSQLTTKAVVGTNGQPSVFSCVGRTSGFYPSPTSCHEYYRCVGDRMYKNRCVLGLVWNPNINTCDWPRNYQCVLASGGDTKTVSTTTGSAITTTVSTTATPTTEATTTQSSTAKSTTQPITEKETTAKPSVIAQAVTVDSGNRESTTAVTTTAGTTTTKKATPPAETTAEATTTTPQSTTTGTTTGATETTVQTTKTTGENPGCNNTAARLHPSPKNCEEYFWCADGVIYSRTCPPPLVFNPEEGYCDWGYNYHCTKGGEDKTPESQTTSAAYMTTTPSKTSDKGSFCMDKPVDGSYRNPQDCSSYFVCLGKVSFFMECAAGTVFDETRRFCDYPFRVPGCN